MERKQWIEDIRFLEKMIEDTHPYPYGRTGKAEFHRQLKTLQNDLAALSDPQIIVKLMQLVGSLQDGHTTLRPVDPNGFNRWYPVRFYWFEDGIFITAAGQAEKQWIGSQVLEIGRLPAEQAAWLAASLQGADNPFGQRERIHYLSNATALNALGIAPAADSVTLTLKPPGGAAQTIELRAVETVFQNDNWMYWGEMYGPPGLAVRSAFHDLPSEEFRKNHAYLPRHVKNRIPFFSEAIEEANAVYMQFNFVQNWENETFSDFHQALFAWIDRHAVERFILDLRYNSGGNGGLLLPFVHQFIKRDRLNAPGHLFVLVGRKTFSAGVNLVGYLANHTHACFIGEPAGAALNHFGDAVTDRLPNSRLALQVSHLYHQMARSDDPSRTIPVQYPAPFTARAYFSGLDPALETVLHGWPRAIPDLLWAQGSGPALRAFHEQVDRFAAYDWWVPFTETQMNDMGYRLLEANRGEDALAAFQLNAARFPESWNAWDSLAEALLKLERRSEAKVCYEKSLSLNAANANAREILAGLGQT